MAKGNEAAFMSLYHRHQGAVFRFAVHMSGKVETAEEIVQEVFLSLLSSPGAFVESSGALQGYLIGAARNLIRTRLKHERRFTEADPNAAGGSQLMDELTKQENLRDLRAAILSLPPNYREVVVLCDLENLDYAVAAEHLGCPVGTVRSRLHRARAILAAKLRERMGCNV
jgi:RNA polymerase sigma-70 factor (ECF subfamily)